METIGDEMTVTIKFDRRINVPEGSLFTALLAEKLEFRGLIEGRYSNSGWGIGTAKVIEVEQLLPADIRGDESLEMLAMRLKEAGFSDLAAKARSGTKRGALLRRLHERDESDSEAARIIIGALP